MAFNKKTVVAGFTLALLVMSFRAEAVITVPCPLAIGTMDCITDSACRTCCINNGYTDGECNGFLWACVCTKGRSQQPEKKPASSEKPPSSPLAWRGMGTFNR
ncbi:hypothetical protein PVAP13_8NG100900 [Panicum virgatum]|uniref:Knottins-like domain-containing protein n=1 Tax=Panicum virgatum TaxID=38727 RepID=A0A8T0PC29_PANVG|nr:hypothetical protein PVAP13_8NG100900 [Panicum virgatum]